MVTSHLVKHLIEVQNCDPNCKGNKGEVPLHAASNNGHLAIVKYLVDTHHCDPQVKADNNWTPLNFAAVNGHLTLVKHLIEVQNCDPNSKDNKGWVSLHYASHNGHLAIVKYLVDTHHCDPQVKADDNWTSLHLAALNGHLELVKHLIEVQNCDPNCKGNKGEVPLHAASKNGHLAIVKYLVDTHHCDPQVKADDNWTSLHLAALNGHLELVKYMIEDRKCDPNCKDNKGEVPLHDASRNGHIEVVKYLVCTFHCNIHSKNNSSLTPLDLARLNSQHPVVSCLLRATAKQIILQSDVISSCVTMYVIGDSGIGKSTLVKSLSFNSSFLGGLFPVKDVEPHTAGIVPSILQSDIFGEVKMYDFAGHKHYYASHEEVLKQLTQPFILLTVDISMSIDDIEKQVTYWTTLISNCHAQGATTQILIIGSHSDKVTFNLRREKEDRIKNIMKTTTLNYHGFVHCDCRYSNSDGMKYLRQRIDTICTYIRRSLASQEDVATNKLCATLMIYLQNLQSRQVTYTINELHTMIKNCPGLASLQDQSQLIIACKALSSNGHFLFLPREEITKSVIVLDEGFILSKVHALLSHVKASLAESKDETGILNEEHLKRISSNSLKGEMEPEIALKYLVFSQLCTQIISHQLILDYKTEDARVYYFFPNLTLASRPSLTDLLSSSEHDYTQLYSWCVKCAKKDSFFTPKLTHTLFIQLVQNDFNRQSTQFKVWKNGILLVHSSGTRSIIEVADDSTQLNFITKSKLGNELAMVEQRSSIISLIKALVRKVCPSVEVKEFLPYPQDSYPDIEHTTEIPLSHVASSVTKNHNYAVAQDTAKSHVPLSRLLFFESFCKIKIPIIQDIFTHQNSKRQVSPSTLSAVAEALKKQNCGELPGNLQEIAHNPHLVTTYSQLYRELHKYTIFPEGNLCVSAHIITIHTEYCIVIFLTSGTGWCRD